MTDVLHRLPGEVSVELESGHNQFIDALKIVDEKTRQIRWVTESSAFFLHGLTVPLLDI